MGLNRIMNTQSRRGFLVTILILLFVSLSFLILQTINGEKLDQSIDVATPDQGSIDVVDPDER